MINFLITAIIWGMVVESGTEKLIKSALLVIKERNLTILTDKDGKFHFNNLKTGEYTLKITHTGYKEKEIKLKIRHEDDKIFLKILLSPRIYSLSKIVVTGGLTIYDDITGKTGVTKEDILTTAGCAGDVFWTLQTLPGISGTGEGAVIALQGGEPDEIKVYVNEAFLPRPFYYEGAGGGLFSLVNTTLLRKGDLYTAGYSASFGDALSGVLNLKLRRGVKKGGKLDISMAGAEISIERKNLILSAGRSYTDLFYRLLYKLHGDTSWTFISFPQNWWCQGIKTFLLKNKVINLFAIFGGDLSAIRLPKEYGTDIYSKSTKGTIGTDFTQKFKNLIINSVASWDYYYTYNEFTDGILKQWEKTQGLNLRSKLQIEFKRIFVESGFSIRLHNPSYYAYYPKDAKGTEFWDPDYPHDTTQKDTSTLKLAQWNLLKFKISEKLFLESGIYGSYLRYNGQKYFDPRGAILFIPSENHKIRFGIGKYHQFPPFVKRYAPFLLTKPHLKPQKSNHYAISYDGKFGKYSVFFEIYKKDYGNLPVYDTANNIYSEGKGYAKGFGFLIRKLKGKISGWISYSYLSSKREFKKGEGLTSSNYDLTHILQIIINYKISEKYKLGLKLRYATGKPYTPLSGVDTLIYNGETYIRPVWGKTNSKRLPDYFKIDLRFVHKYKMFGKPCLSYTEIWNLTSHKNYLGVSYSKNYDKEEFVQWMGGIMVFGGFIMKF